MVITSNNANAKWNEDQIIEVVNKNARAVELLIHGIAERANECDTICQSFIRETAELAGHSKILIEDLHTKENYKELTNLILNPIVKTSKKASDAPIQQGFHVRNAKGFKVVYSFAGFIVRNQYETSRDHIEQAKTLKDIYDSHYIDIISNDKIMSFYKYNVVYKYFQGMFNDVEELTADFVSSFAVDLLFGLFGRFRQLQEKANEKETTVLEEAIFENRKAAINHFNKYFNISDSVHFDELEWCIQSKAAFLDIGRPDQEKIERAFDLLQPKSRIIVNLLLDGASLENMSIELKLKKRTLRNKIRKICDTLSEWWKRN